MINNEDMKVMRRRAGLKEAHDAMPTYAIPNRHNDQLNQDIQNFSSRFKPVDNAVDKLAQEIAPIIKDNFGYDFSHDGSIVLSQAIKKTIMELMRKQRNTNAGASNKIDITV